MNNISNYDVQVSNLAGQFLFHWWSNDFEPLIIEDAINLIRRRAKQMGIKGLENEVLNFLTDLELLIEVPMDDETYLYYELDHEGLWVEEV